MALPICSWSPRFAPTARILTLARRHFEMRAVASTLSNAFVSSLVRPRSFASRGVSSSRAFVRRAAGSDSNDIHNLDGQYDSAAAPYVRVRRVSEDEVRALEDILLSLGATSVSTVDADKGTENEKEIFSANTFEEAASDDVASRVWSSCDMTAYFPSHDVARESIAAAEEILGASFDVSYETSKANDWVQVVKDSFTPTKIADGLFIVPDWCDNVDKNAVNIVLEPGIAFGTGEHPTTRLCLRWLKETLARRGATELVVDFGCGSGVLAIGALVMGAKRAVGVDLAEQAVQSTMDNANLNGVSDRIIAYRGDGTDPGTPGADGQADLVVANILIGPVLDLEELLAGYCRTGGEIALSGILYGEQSDSVVERYCPHFDEIKVESEDGWACVHGVRNAVPV